MPEDNLQREEEKLGQEQNANPPEEVSNQDSSPDNGEENREDSQQQKASQEASQETKQEASQETNQETSQETGQETSQEANQEAQGQESLPELEELKAKLAAKEKEAEELFSRLQRLQADFDNFRRRTRKELENMARYGSEKVMAGLLQVIDNFEYALKSSKKEGEASAFMTGMEMIYRQLKEVLEKEGLKAIEALGQPFNPEIHEAVAQVEAESAEQDNIIVEELQVGYTLYDKLLRPSRVKVAKYHGE